MKYRQLVAFEGFALTPADFRKARKALGLSQREMAEALRLSPANGDRTIRIWEAEGNTVPGPAQVAVEMMLAMRRFTHGL